MENNTQQLKKKKKTLWSLEAAFLYIKNKVIIAFLQRQKEYIKFAFQCMLLTL